MEIAHGEAVFLCGASGAGKTTLLYTLAGLERPESGSVEFEGRLLYNGSSAWQARLRNEKMGFVFQGYFLLPELTAVENVSLPGMIGREKGVRRDSHVVRVGEVRVAVGIGESRGLREGVDPRLIAGPADVGRQVVQDVQNHQSDHTLGVRGQLVNLYIPV